MEAVRLAPATHGRPDLDVELPGWYAEARCLDADPDAFFGEGKGDQSALEAVKVCRTCPVVEPCLAYVVDRPDLDYGVWGGTTPKQRRRLRRQRQAC